jgi:hypothetical protein
MIARGNADCIRLPQDRIEWRVVAITVMNLRLLRNAED